MSTLYNLEPQPTAKVLLNTTSGDLVVEIFAKQVPLAARNFLQHCLNGYYNGTIFHRLVPGFIIQGGDPTGTGSGGVSAINDGAPFQDEFHSRLKFNRRGLLGMANSGDKNDNTSQFFFTLDKTPELQDKNTMFGRIEGDTIYNLMKMAEADLTNDDSDRPLYPTSIRSTDILLNPFNDMVKQASFATVTTQETSKAPKKKRKAQKTLLSFGGDDGEEPAAPVVKKVKVNPNFTAPDPQQPSAQNELSTTKAAEQPKREKPVRKKSPTPSPPPPTAASTTSQAPVSSTKPPRKPSPSPTPTPSPEPRKLTALERTNAEIASLKASMKRTTTQTSAPEKKLSALESMIPASSTRGRKRGKAKEDTFSLSSFNAFKARLETLPAEKTTSSTNPAATTTTTLIPETATTTTTTTTTTKQESSSSALDTEEKLCDLHFIANCQSCSTWHDDEAENENDDDDDNNDSTWMSHALSFAKDTLGKDLEWKRKMEEFEVIDPREKTREIVGEKGGRKGREWDREREREKKGKGRV
ncbi:cyclophilin-like protein [Aureobasidium subglaciale]|nr:cyclophilin-like protein [Aureobasidium subglaciale]